MILNLLQIAVIQMNGSKNESRTEIYLVLKLQLVNDILVSFHFVYKLIYFNIY